MEEIEIGLAFNDLFIPYITSDDMKIKLIELLSKANNTLTSQIRLFKSKLDPIHLKETLTECSECFKKLKNSIVPKGVTDYVIKLWIQGDDNISETCKIKSFCGLKENWRKAKFDKQKDKLILEREVSCSLACYRAAIEKINDLLIKKPSYRSFEIKRNNIELMKKMFEDAITETYKKLNVLKEIIKTTTNDNINELIQS